MDHYGKRIIWTSLIGLFLSIYALHVDYSTQYNDSEGGAMCDINERFSCSKVFHSRYGRGFFGLLTPIIGDESVLNQPNSVSGIAFYSLMILLAFLPNRGSAKTQLILNVVANLITIYLAYLLYFVLETICLVCVSLYAVNAINLVWSCKRLTVFRGKTEKEIGGRGRKNK